MAGIDSRKEGVHQRYDASQHLHLGYYDGGHDFEAIALKVEGENLWHIFFPFDSYDLPVPAQLAKALRQSEFGSLIFTAKKETGLQQRFVQWVERELLPLRASEQDAS